MTTRTGKRGGKEKGGMPPSAYLVGMVVSDKPAWMSDAQWARHVVAHGPDDETWQPVIDRLLADSRCTLRIRRRVEKKPTLRSRYRYAKGVLQTWGDEHADTAKKTKSQKRADRLAAEQQRALADLMADQQADRRRDAALMRTRSPTTKTTRFRDDCGENDRCTESGKP